MTKLKLSSSSTKDAVKIAKAARPVPHAPVKLESILIPVEEQLPCQAALDFAAIENAVQDHVPFDGHAFSPMSGTKCGRPFGYSVIRTAYILRSFMIAADLPTDVSQMATHLGFAASTVHRVLSLMSERGLAKHELKRGTTVAGEGAPVGVRSKSKAFAWSLDGTKEEMEIVFGPCPATLDVTVDAESETMAYSSIWAVAQGVSVSTRKTKGVRGRFVASGIALQIPQHPSAESQPIHLRA